MKTQHLLSFAALAAGLGMATGMRADEQAPGRSPFLPANSGQNAGQQATDPNALELKGIMPTPDGPKYNIYDPTKKTGVWLAVNEQGNNFVIKSADPEHDQVTILANGLQTVVTMKESKILTPAANGVPMGGAVLRPTPEDEQRRLQAVADEVRRRRLLREQAAQQAGANGQPANIPPQIQTGAQPQAR